MGRMDFRLLITVLLITLVLCTIIPIVNSSKTKTGKLRVTKEHPFFVDGKWVKAKNLKIGDKLKTANGDTVIVNSITKVSKNKTKVFNLKANGLKNYFANNILVHNKPMEYQGVTNRVLEPNPSNKEFFMPDESSDESLTRFLYDSENNRFIKIPEGENHIDVYNELIKCSPELEGKILGLAASQEDFGVGVMVGGTSLEQTNGFPDNYDELFEIVKEKVMNLAEIDENLIMQVPEN